MKVGTLQCIGKERRDSAVLPAACREDNSVGFDPVTVDEEGRKRLAGALKTRKKTRLGTFHSIARRGERVSLR